MPSNTERASLPTTFDRVAAATPPGGRLPRIWPLTGWPEFLGIENEGFASTVHESPLFRFGTFPVSPG
jgi:hypothetical protein